MAKRTEKLAAMGEMAANIAHEIRNPLGSIELFASLARKETTDRKNQERLMQIISSVKSMDNRISNLLLFARRPNPAMRSLRLHRILDDVLHFTRQVTERDGIVLRERFSARDPLVRGDAEMLKQVFLNIILNALQSMPEGGRLTIATAQRETATVEISFSDTGAGIPEENLRRIFDPLFSTRERGAGLGLAIVHNLVDLHGGAIEVESGAGGTVFTVSLPTLRRRRSK
jgi:signal transduction histidine kinase